MFEIGYITSGEKTMPAPKKYIKRVQVKSASYPTYACYLTPWGKALVQSVGHKFSTQTDYFTYLSKKHSRDLVDIRSMSKALSLGREEYNGKYDFTLLPLYLRANRETTAWFLAKAKAHYN